MFDKSILLQKAKAIKIESIELVYEEPVGTQITLFKETIEDLENYLDYGDLAKLNEKSMGVIKTDILSMIQGFKIIKKKYSTDALDYVTSLDMILEKLRDAKNVIIGSEYMFPKISKIEDKDAFLEKLSKCRILLEEVLKAFN